MGNVEWNSTVNFNDSNTEGSFIPNDSRFYITETRLFKYIENFTTKKWQIKNMLFFIFLLKT